MKRFTILSILVLALVSVSAYACDPSTDRLLEHDHGVLVTPAAAGPGTVHRFRPTGSGHWYDRSTAASSRHWYDPRPRSGGTNASGRRSRHWYERFRSRQILAAVRIASGLRSPGTGTNRFRTAAIGWYERFGSPPIPAAARISPRPARARCVSTNCLVGEQYSRSVPLCVTFTT